MTRDVYRRLVSARGMSRIGSLVFWIFLLLVALTLYMFAEPIYDNWALGGTFKSIAMKASSMEDTNKIKEYALVELQKRGYTITADQLVVAKDGKFVDLSATYPVEIGLPGIGPLMIMRFSKSGSNR